MIYIPDLVEIGCSPLNISPVWTKCLLAPLNNKCCQYNKIICLTSWLKWYPLIPSLIHLLWSHVHESCSPFLLQMNAQWPILWNMHLSLQANFVFLTLHEKNIYLVVVVGRLIVNSIARLALGRVPINRTCRPSLDLCRAIIKINTTRRPPSWKVRAIGRIHCNSLLEWITVYNLTEPAELVSYKVYMILCYSMHYIDTLFQVEIDA